MKTPRTRVLLLLRRAQGGMLTHVEAAIRTLPPAVRLGLAGEVPGELVSLAAQCGFPVVPFSLGDDLRREDFASRRRLEALLPEYDVLHAHGLKAGLLAASLGAGLPLVYTAHNLAPSGVRGRLHRLLERRLAHRAARVLVVSAALQTALLHSGVPAAKIVLLPPPVDVDFFRTVPPPPREAVLGTLARLEPRKGLDLLLAALRRLHDEGVAARLLLAGDGPLRSRLEELAQRFGVASSVRFLGRLPRQALPSFFADIRLYVQPSRSEGLGLAVLEAAAAGRGAVVTAVGGLPSTVTAGESGLVVPLGAVPLAKAIAEALPRAELYGQAARERIARSVTQLGPVLANIYQEVSPRR